MFQPHIGRFNESLANRMSSVRPYNHVNRGDTFLWRKNRRSESAWTHGADGFLSA